MVADQRARPAMAIRPHHTVGRARFRSDEPADADGPRRAVLDRMDGPMAGRSRARRRPEIRRDHRMGRLGYPRRALRLQECAHVIAYDYADELPHTYDELFLLCPGIGDYTASAVLSFAFGERIAVVDTNIRRVLSRAFVRRRIARRQRKSPRNARWRNGCCRTMIPRNAVVSIAVRRVEPGRHGTRRDGVHCEIAIMRSLSDRRKMRVPTQRKTGIGAAAYATTPTIPRYGPAGARAGAERAARPAGWRDGA